MTNIKDRIKNFVTRFKDLTTIGFANVVGNLISGIFWLYIARLLGTEHYGEVSYFIAIASIASTISFLGSGNTAIIFTAKGIRILPPLYFISLIGAVITSAILFLIFYDIDVSLYVVGYGIFTLACSEMLGLKLYKNYSKYLIVQRLMIIGLAIGLYFVMGPHGIILGYALSFFPFVFNAYKSFRGGKIDFSVLKPRLGFMMNSYVLDLSRSFSGYTDKLIVGPLFGFALLGNYQLGIQFLSILTTLPGIVYQYILPQDASGNSNKKLKKVTIVFSGILAILGILLSPIVLPILFPKFTNAVEVIQITSLATVPATINLMYISRFLGGEKAKLVLIGSGIYLTVQIVAIAILGKLYGINGIATSVVLAATSESLYLVIVERFLKQGKS
jgi:O-antigen/teichoic acid export membrane protein